MAVKNISRARLGVQILSFILINAGLFGLVVSTSLTRVLWLPIASCHYLEKSLLHGYLYEVQQGAMSASLLIMVVPLLVLAIMIAVLGRSWCGWCCPIGLISDLVTRVRQKLGLSHIRLTKAQRETLSVIRYAALFLTVLISLSLGLSALGLAAYKSTLSLPYCQLCPAQPIFLLLQMSVGILPTNTGIPVLSLLVLGIFLTGSFGVRRFWCRICPIGAGLSLLNRQSTLWLSKDSKKCTKCGICARVCPMEVKRVYEEDIEPNVTTMECIMCFRCVELCPEEGCLGVNFLDRGLKGSRYPFAEVDRDTRTKIQTKEPRL